MNNLNITDHDDRRRTERFITSPMHHAVSIRTFDADTFKYDGHAYDISEGGICFELMDPIAPGTEVGVMIHLPIGFDRGPGRAVFVSGRVVWLSDCTEVGPVRMGVVFDRFSRVGDQQRLHRFLNQGICRAAA